MFNSRIKSRLVAQFQDSKCVTSQLTTDYRGKSYTASFTVGNIDILKNQGLGVLQYFQGVTPRVALGAEVMYQYGPQIPGGGVAGKFFLLIRKFYICNSYNCTYI